jgi:glucose dehydrogenase/plastocyanin
MASVARRPRSLAVVLLVVAVAVLAWAPIPGGRAQEAELDQGPATPAPLGPAIPPEITDFAGDWPAPMGDLAGTRNAQDSPIDSSNVAQLEVAWTFPLEATGAYGAITGTPIVAGDTVYIQDMSSNVYALDRATGELKWQRDYDVPTVGPNGVALGYGLVFATLGDTAEVVALRAESGEEVWRVDLSNNLGEGVDMAPTVYDNVVYVSTVPGSTERFYRGGQKGILYALEAATGHTIWQFDTTTENLWTNPRINSGGGLWYPLSVDEEGNVYFGVGNAAPWPGTEEYPNGTSRPGPNDYASSMVSLDTKTGALRWYHNAKPHDLFDLDFQLTPIVTTIDVGGQQTKVAIGAGKTGTVIAADADSGEVLWEVEVGIHQDDDLQEIPEGETVEVYPGALGGVETPMAYADGVVFVPIVNSPTSYTSTGPDLASIDITNATGELVALNAADGSVKWQVELPQMALAAATVANDVVFTGALDGVFRAYSTETGDELWTHQLNAGLNAPPAVAGDMVFVGAGGPLLQPPAADGATPAAQPEARTELVAFRLGGAAAPAGTPAADETPAAPAQTPAPAETPAAETPAPDGETPAASGEAVTVAMVDIDFNPAAFSIPAGTDVPVSLPNNGALPHNFSIDELGIDVDVAAGDTGSTTINAAAGEYQYYCNVPGHRGAGMVGTLTVD